MARKRPSRGRARLALLLRLLGATGLFVALLGLIPLGISFDLSSAGAWESALRDYVAELPLIRFENTYLDVGLTMLLAGGVVFAFTLLLLTVGGLRTIAGRRNAAATNAVLQSALAVALLVGVNVFAFRHYQRYDWTRNQQFTLPADVAGELRKLRGPTDIVVYQRHKTFGQLSEKPDAYDYAAERKVVEKVQDLVEQFREFGPQFRVQVLDVEEEGYEQKLHKLAQEAPALRAALDAAPDNSIFFHSRREVGRKADGRADVVRESVQRLSFNEFYQLDKTASQSADDGRGNLVLLPQGVGPFARKVLAIEERRPRVGIAVIHEYLSSEGLEELSMAGARKALTTHGFDVTDLILKKKWGESNEPEPAAYTLGESRYERLQEELREVDDSLQSVQSVRRQLTAALDRFRSATLDELTRQFQDQLGGRRFTEELRKRQIEGITADLGTLDFVVQQNTEARKQLDTERQSLAADERVVEDRRMTDLKAKMTKLLGECDLLIVPRMTIRDIISGYRIAPRFYRLDDVQVGAVKEFLKAGKPVLACFGPTNEPADRRSPLPPGPDNFEELFAQLGVRFGKQTILFGSDSKAFAERRSNVFATGSSVEWPLVRFEPPDTRASATYKPSATLSGDEPKLLPLNSIALSMRLIGRSVGGSQKLDLRLKHPRPVYYVPARAAVAGVSDPGHAEPGFVFGDPDSWNEDQPFPTRERTPRFEPPKPDDPAKGTRDEKQFHAFPLAVAVETTVPAEWKDPRVGAAKAAGLVADGAGEASAALTVAADGGLPADVYAPKGERPTTVRVAAVGHGGLFVGPELSPAKERLLLNTCNWLLGRDERLPHESAEPWRYPRVHLDERAQKLWFWGTLVALPGLFIYAGRVVLLARRFR
jgi:hypothetical protein